MKAALSSCVFAAVAMLAAAAPAPAQDEPRQAAEQKPESLRQKRSSYGSPSYGSPYLSPCGAASVPIPAVAPAPYHLNLAPAHHAGYSPHGYGYLPQYRADIGDEQEMMNFSDMEPFMSEHMPMARYAYGAPAAHYGAAGAGLGPLVAPASSATAFGVFPNANVGGCSVPLLLSCSPSVVPGRIVTTHPHTSYGSAVVVPAGSEAYRVVDDHQVHHEGHDQVEEHPAHEQMQSAHDAGQMGVHQ